MNLYQELLTADVPLDNHESDLYALVTKESTRLVQASGRHYSTFISNIDGRLWYEIPFAYAPWWEQRQRYVNPARVTVSGGEYMVVGISPPVKTS